MAKQRLRKRVFRALKEGFKQGFQGIGAVEVVEKPLSGRPVIAAMEGEESVREFVDGGLRSGRIPTEQWGIEDGKSKGV